MRADTADAPELNDRGQGASFTYDAFLSYNHQDGAVAAGIQKGLHRIGRRMGQLNALRVFRDTTDMAANPDLWGKVTDAMDRSRYLIVVLSPRAAASEWVNKEVAYWLEQRGPDQLLIVVAEGHLHWDEATERFDPRPVRRRVAGADRAWGAGRRTAPRRRQRRRAVGPAGTDVPRQGHRPGRPDPRQIQVRTGQR